ncbi:unnamed protein product [Brassica rapa subsp. narinosa]|uniref:(rape) hypothetical protein n=1 Tax=Brassica napus TaxID=3708 RepID=A0A816ZSF4_BRANA|nr:unnamed protein product [Brassica napus]
MTAATTFRGRLISGKTTNLVMVVTTVDSKIFQVNRKLGKHTSQSLGLHYFDTKVLAIQEFTNKSVKSLTLPIVLSKSTDQLRSSVSYNKMSCLTFLAPVAIGNWKNQG